MTIAVRRSSDWQYFARFLSYDPESGDLTWIVTRKKMRPGDLAGTFAGSLSKRVCLNYKYFPVSHLCWLLHHKRWPEVIRHKNGDMNDFRLENLVPSTRDEMARMMGEGNRGRKKKCQT